MPNPVASPEPNARPPAIADALTPLVLPRPVLRLPLLLALLPVGTTLYAPLVVLGPTALVRVVAPIPVVDGREDRRVLEEEDEDEELNVGR